MDELRGQNWVPVAVEEQRIRNEARRGFQKHLIRFRSHSLDARGSLDLARHALQLRYDSLETAPVEPDTLLKARRPEDEGTDLWRTMNRLLENLERGGVSDSRRDKRGKLRSVRALRGIDSKVSLNKGLWGLAEQLANGEPLTPVETVELTA